MNSTQFLEFAVSVSVQAALVVAASHWLGRLMDSERAQSRLWTACYVALLLLLTAGLVLPHQRLLQPWSDLHVETAARLASAEIILGRLLFFVWAGGALLSLLAFGFQLARIQRFIRSCEPVDPNMLSTVGLNSESTALLTASPTRPVRLMKSAKLATPFCWQFHRPYILLPEYLAEGDRPELRFIIQHEIEHLRTGHPLQLFLQQAVETIFWFHPMVWWASHRSALSREFACDEAAIDSPADISAYLRSLLIVVERATAQSDESQASLTFGGERSIVAERARRLVMIAQGHSLRGNRRIPAWAVSLCLVVAMMLAGFVWLPVNVLSSARSTWSPWPSWSSRVLHDFGIRARDFEVYDRRSRHHELFEEARRDTSFVTNETSENR